MIPDREKYVNLEDVKITLHNTDSLGKAAWDVISLPYIVPPKWIPVTPETMPEDYGTYICTCFDGCANRVTFVKWQNKLKQWILNGSRSYWKVIAWMPLPEPYKGGDA